MESARESRRSPIRGARRKNDVRKYLFHEQPATNWPIGRCTERKTAGLLAARLLLPVLHDVDPTGRPDPRRARTSPIGASRIRPEALPYREPPKRVEPLYFPPISSGIPVRNRRHGRSFIRARRRQRATADGDAFSERKPSPSAPDTPPFIYSIPN